MTFTAAQTKKRKTVTSTTTSLWRLCAVGAETLVRSSCLTEKGCVGNRSACPDPLGLTSGLWLRRAGLSPCRLRRPNACWADFSKAGHSFLESTSTNHSTISSSPPYNSGQGRPGRPKRSRPPIKRHLGALPPCVCVKPVRMLSDFESYPVEFVTTPCHSCPLPYTCIDRIECWWPSRPARRCRECSFTVEPPYDIGWAHDSSTPFAFMCIHNTLCDLPDLLQQARPARRTTTATPCTRKSFQLNRTLQERAFSSTVLFMFFSSHIVGYRQRRIHIKPQL